VRIQRRKSLGVPANITTSGVAATAETFHAEHYLWALPHYVHSCPSPCRACQATRRFCAGSPPRTQEHRREAALCTKLRGATGRTVMKDRSAKQCYLGPRRVRFALGGLRASPPTPVGPRSPGDGRVGSVVRIAVADVFVVSLLLSGRDGA